MIAAGRKGVGVSGSNSRSLPLQSGRDHPGMAERDGVPLGMTPAAFFPVNHARVISPVM